MAQCIITSFENSVAVYFNDIIPKGELELFDGQRNLLASKKFSDTDYFIIRQDNLPNGFVDAIIRTGTEVFKKRIYIHNNKKQTS